MNYIESGTSYSLCVSFESILYMLFSLFLSISQGCCNFQDVTKGAIQLCKSTFCFETEGPSMAMMMVHSFLVLMQVQNVDERVISYGNRTLSVQEKKERNFWP